MKPFATSSLTKLFRQYLSSKFDTSCRLTSTYSSDFNSAIDNYNYFRHHQTFKKYYKYLINAIELNNVFDHDLPAYDHTIGLLLSDHKFADKVFIYLRDNSYFQEVWAIKPIKYLHMNLLLLLYRTTILFNNSFLLVDASGNHRVQISSTIEEMVFCLHLEGVHNQLFPAFAPWLDKWKDEGFDKRLYDMLLTTRT
jgi:hypothetical protein